MENFNPFPTFRYRADRCHDGMRLDRFLSLRMAWRSRSSIRRAIEAGRITVENRPVKPGLRLHPGDLVTIRPEPRELPPFDPASVRLDLIYEDDVIAVFNKPAGIVVHPTGTHLNNTFLHALVHHYRDSRLPDGGPVLPVLAHRIDRNTSGVLLLSKDPRVRSELNRQFSEGEVEKEYRAIVHGAPVEDAYEIDLPIGLEKDSDIKIKRGIRRDTGAPARTRVRVLGRFDGYAYVSAEPVTGRTHQIRVHLSATGTPIAADDIYAGEERVTASNLRAGAGDGVVLARHALHARRLVITHPVARERMTFSGEEPTDMRRALDLLRGGGEFPAEG
jgi:23S rRNA pseudouridine1911/1915/1917 synthase